MKMINFWWIYMIYEERATSIFLFIFYIQQLNNLNMKFVQLLSKFTWTILHACFFFLICCQRVNKIKITKYALCENWVAADAATKRFIKLCAPFKVMCISFVTHILFAIVIISLYYIVITPYNSNVYWLLFLLLSKTKKHILKVKIHEMKIFFLHYVQKYEKKICSCQLCQT